MLTSELGFTITDGFLMTVWDNMALKKAGEVLFLGRKYSLVL